MENHYRTLGLVSSATAEEIRRAYRILARRYHPDLNPEAKTDDRFKRIADAYRVLNDPEKRKQFDLDLEAYERLNGRSTSTQSARNRRDAGLRREFERRKFEQFGSASERDEPSEPPRRPAPKSPKGPQSQPKAARLNPILNSVKGALQWWNTLGNKATPAKEQRGISRISIIEVSITVRDAILGVKKTVEIEEPVGSRKISVSIPPGVRNGSVVRLRAKSSVQEEIVLIVRLSSHPFIGVYPKGIVVEVPITVLESLAGASISVPTLETPISIRIPPGSQSGTEIRVKDGGIKHRDGTRGDLFYRLMIWVPDSPDAVGIKEQAKQLDAYYGSSVRQALPASLLSD